MPIIGKVLADRDIRILAEKTLPSLLITRKEYQKLAREAYLAALKAAYPEQAPVEAPVLRDYTLDEWEGSLKKRLQTIIDGKIQPVVDIEPALLGADLHARNAERNHAVAYSIDDPRAVGWARYDPISPTCSWCELQISRGPVFQSRRTATSGREDWHTGCTCEAVQVFKGKPYRGEEQFKQLRKIYDDQPGQSSKDKLRNFRRARAGKPVEGSSLKTAKSVVNGDPSVLKKQIAALEAHQPKTRNGIKYKEKQLSLLKNRLSSQE